MNQFSQVLGLLKISANQFNANECFEEISVENSSGKVVDYISLWRAFRRSVVKNPETEENSISDDEVIRDAILRCFSVTD
jgi:hypothetical protein